jgi:hypothetical protein
VLKAWVEAAGGKLCDGAAHLPHELPRGPARTALVDAVVGMRLRVVWMPPRQGDLDLHPKSHPPGGQNFAPHLQTGTPKTPKSPT